MKHFLHLTILLLILVNVAWGQNIEGRLLDNVSGEPIPGAEFLLKKTNNSAYSNASGKFIFNEIKPDYYVLEIKVNDIVIKSIEITHLSTGTNLGDISVTASNTQSINDISVIDISDLASIENENDNFSSALSAGRDPFIDATTFNLIAGRFRPRGYFNEDSEMIMNGMLMNDQDDGRVLWTSWNGLNDVMRNRTNVVNLSESDLTFGGIGGASIIDLRASSQRDEKKITYANSNRTFQHRIMATYSTGLMKNGWAIAATASYTYGTQGYIKGTHMQGNSYFLSIDRKLNDNHVLNFVVFGSPQRRGRSTGSVQEMYDISGDNFYNPNWGFQNGAVRSAREYRIHQPVSILRHDWKISNKTKVMTSIGVQTGRYGSTRLDWFDAPDPRPDYYRRLPSYATVPETKDQITNFLKADEGNRQINWQALYDANATRNYTIENADGIAGTDLSGKLAAYIMESENYDNQKINFNSVINSQISEKINFAGGVQYLNEKVHYYRRVEDLLGADFYIDFNRFALRDFPDNKDAGQNDVNRPNRILKKGDVFGHDYDIHTNRASGWGQLIYVTPKFDFMAGLMLTYQSFYREGFTKTGIFPDNSFGKSEKNNFFNSAFKGGITYKIDGRNYLTLNGTYRTRAPFASESFVSPRVRDQVVSDLKNEQITSVDISYLVRYTKLKARVSAFYTNFRNKISNDVFYHEDFQTFVNYIMTGIDRKHTGLEIGLEYNLTSKISLSAAGALGEYFHSSRPVATISRDNSAADFVTDRTIFIDNYYFSGTPQTAGTVGITYRSTKFWFFDINVNGFSKNYLSFNPDRRTAEAVKTINPTEQNELYLSVIQQERLPDGITVDFSMGKSTKLKDGSYLRINLNAGNILNNTKFISGGFEQLRFDYETKNVNRFPPRYFYSYGLNYNLNVSYTFAR
ncbi:MAG: TonB-dependent receptor [Saprospiraceae bacterium]|nr:TonB-dependent receptor [Saprospiraceae bacterium]